MDLDETPEGDLDDLGEDDEEDDGVTGYEECGDFDNPDGKDLTEYILEQTGDATATVLFRHSYGYNGEDVPVLYGYVFDGKRETHESLLEMRTRSGVMWQFRKNTGSFRVEKQTRSKLYKAGYVSKFRENSTPDSPSE